MRLARLLPLLTALALCAPGGSVASAHCVPSVAAAARVQRGAGLALRYHVCGPGRIRMGLIALEDAHRGKLVLRRTVTVAEAGDGTAGLTIGALQTGRYRLVLYDAAGAVHHGGTVVVYREVTSTGRGPSS